MDSSGFWYQEPLRIIQTVLRQIDAIDYDPRAVVRHVLENNANVLVVNAGGIFDFFENPLPAASPVEQLHGRDLLREISDACRESGIKLITRVDFRGVREPIYDEHPDWFAKNADGSPVQTGYTSLPLYAPCYNSYYRNEHSEQFIRYVLENYGVDGIWHNAVLVPHTCYCDRCRASYREYAGTDIPVEGAGDQEAFKTYFAWKAIQARANIERLRGVVKSVGEDRAYIAEVFHMFHVADPVRTGLDLYDAADVFDFLVSVAFLTENAVNLTYDNLLYPSILTRFLRSLAPEKQPVMLFGGNGTSRRYVMDPPADTRAWLWQGAATGSGFWNCLFNGHHPGDTHDVRNARIERDVYTYVRDNSGLLRDALPVADAVIFYSQTTKIAFGSEVAEEDQYVGAVQGIARVLTEYGIQYSFVSDKKFALDDLDNVKLLCLPNVACLSDSDCETIREYVRAGGRLLATHHTSLFDEAGRPRSDFALADLFGCSYAGETVDSRKDTFQQIADPVHPVLEKVTGTSLLAAGARTALCARRSNEAEVILWHVPMIVNQPPELAWRETMRDEHPVALANRFGEGQVIYLAGQPDLLSERDGHEDFRTLLGSSASYLLGPNRFMETDAPASVTCTALYSRSASAYVISLANQTSAPVRPLRSIVPVRDIRLKLFVDETRVAEARKLYGGAEPVVTETKGAVEVRVSEVEEFYSFAVKIAE